MAGSGQRFVDQSFKTPKPLIIINGKPMFYHAIKVCLYLKIIFLFVKKKCFLNKKFKYYLKYFKKSKLLILKRKLMVKQLLAK